MALASSTGATMVTSPHALSASASARMPSERYPSSLVTRIRVMRGINYNEEQQRRDERERRAGAECRCRPVPAPDESKHETRRQRAKSEHGIVDAKCEATALGRDEIGDERLLGAFGQSEIETVREKADRQRDQAAAGRSEERRVGKERRRGARGVG